jgi:hypothetical protein
MRRSAVPGVIVALLALLLSASTQAADIKIVRNGDFAAVSLRGPIIPEDYDAFRAQLNFTPAAVVFLESTGGSTNTALGIGRIIRRNGFETVVLDNSKCASACALIWIAGSPRRMGTNAKIGFHQPRNP